MLATQTFTGTGQTLSVVLEDDVSRDFIFQVTGSGTHTLAVQLSNDGTTWVAVQLTPVGGGAAVTSVSAAGMWRVEQVGGAQRIRVQSTVAGTGSMVALLGGARRR